MLDKIIQLATTIHPIKTVLIVGSVLISGVLIVLNNNSILPLALGDFLFFSGIVFLCALYRPGWAFLFFIGLLPFEIVSVAPKEIGFMLRSYQWVGMLTLVATIVRFLGGRLPFSLPRIGRFDFALIVLWMGSLVAAMYAPDRGVSVKQSIVALSFIVLYALVRIFIRSFSDVKNTIAFFIGSGVVVSVYALWQNMRFLSGANAFEVMAGRSNSVFAEPDWLGAFVAVCIAALYVILPIYQKRRGCETGVLFTVLTLLYVTLILSVSRSAWLGVALITIASAFIVLIDSSLSTVSLWKWRKCLVHTGRITATFFISLTIVLMFHLTTFQLFNRAQSTVSGLQSITVACTKDISLPHTIVSVDELVSYDCRHIALEERELMEKNGEVIKEVYRNDPNVTIRKEVYTKTIVVIREHFFTGIGFGSSTSFLGNDARGTGLNSSNIFLEVWLGAGLIGLLAFTFVWLSIGVSSCKRLLTRQKSDGIIAVQNFIFLSWIGLTVFNLFNAGMFLGFFWAWLAVSVSFIQKKI